MSVSPEELARRVAEKPNTSFYNIVQYLISIIKVYILQIMILIKFKKQET